MDYFNETGSALIEISYTSKKHQLNNYGIQDSQKIICSKIKAGINTPIMLHLSSSALAATPSVISTISL
jgi:hypothetical protein